MKQKERNIFAYLLACLMIFSFAATSLAQDKPKKYVLILHSYHKGQHWNEEIIKGIESVLKDNEQNIEHYHEYMDTKRFSDERHIENLHQLLRYKYRNQTFDAIISSDDHAFNFLLKNSETLFPETPIVFCGVNRFDKSSIVGRKWITGVVESTDLEKTIEIAMQLHPKTKNIFVLVDKTVSGMAHRRQIEDIIPHFDKTVTFDLLEDVELPSIKNKLQELPKNSIVLWMNLYSDKNQNPISLEQGGVLLKKHCDAPAYSLWDNRLGKGIIGGKLISGYFQGKTAARMAHRIMQGEKVEDIQIIDKSPNLYKFDYEQMIRFDIEISDLPVGSAVINQPFSFYSENKRLIWIVAGNTICLVAIIVILLLNMFYRKRAEDALRESEAKYSAMISNISDVIAIVGKDGMIKYKSPNIEKHFGWQPMDLVGEDSWHTVHPDDLTRIQEEFFDLLKKDMSEKNVEYRYKCKDGSYTFITLTAFNLINNPVINGILMNYHDITERKQAESNLISSNERLLAEKKFSKAIIDTNHTIIVGLDKNHLIRIFSRGAELITGYSKAEVLGKDWNALFLYFENQKNLDKAWKAAWEQNYNALSCSVNWGATQENSIYTVTGPLRIRNGATRTILWQNTKIHTGHDESKHMHISIGVDITERKQAEEQIKASLKEKEVLLQEIHHRVKNNMQVIISLLKLQSGNITDKQYLDMFKESQHRIKSMALVHEKLYQTKNLADIDFKGYVKSLVISLFRSYKTKPGKITLKTEVGDVALGLERAVPCGLIINELVSNSLKYAFPEERAGEIRVAFNSTDENMLVLEVSDNGIGMPEKLDFRNTESLGLHLVTILSEDQLHGTIELNRTDGTKFYIRFKNI